MWFLLLPLIFRNSTLTMGKFVVSDSNSDEAFGYARDGSDEAQSSHKSINNNEILSSNSSDGSSDDRGTRAQRS